MNSCRIAENNGREMRGSAYSYFLGIHCYALNTFLALPKLSVFSIRDKVRENYIRVCLCSDTHMHHIFSCIHQLITTVVISFGL